MKYSLFILLFLSASFSARTQDTTTLNLPQALAYARTHQASLQNAGKEVEIARQTVKSIVATGLPQINASGAFIHNIEIASQQLPDFLSPAIYGVLMAEGLIPDGPISLGNPQEVQFGAPSTMIGSVSMSQLIFDGTFFLGLKAAKEFVKVSELQRNMTEIQLIESVSKAFYGVLIAGENLMQIRQSLANVEKTLTEVERMYQAGFAEKLDVDRLKLSRSTLQTQSGNLQSQHQIMLLMFKYTIGMPVETPLKLTGTINSEEARSVAATQSDAVRDRIELQILRQQLVLDSLSIDRFRVGYIPSIYLNMNHQRNTFASAAEFVDLGKTWYPGTSYTVSLSIPIFDGFYKKAKIAEARIKLAKDQNTLTDFQNAVQLQISQTELNYRVKLKTLENEEANRQLARDIYQSTLTRFREGLGSSLELTQADGEQTQAEIRYMNALYELMVARIDLSKALGTLND